MADHTRLADLADDLLAAVVDAADVHEVDLPERRIIADGAVAWDCPLVAVALPQISRGTVTADAATAHRPSDTYVAQFAVWLLRSVPGMDKRGDPPPAADVTASGHQLLEDGWLLSVGLRPALRKLGKACPALAAGTLTAQGPEGGLAGWQAIIRVGV